LVQPQHDKQIGNTAMSDYRRVYRADFDIVHSYVRGESYEYGLKAIKPSRCTIA
jgi:hypothetical protein